jgi:hypothetical protein
MIIRRLMVLFIKTDTLTIEPAESQNHMPIVQIRCM